jgi:hypothetical protein
MPQTAHSTSTVMKRQVLFIFDEPSFVMWDVGINFRYTVPYFTFFFNLHQKELAVSFSDTEDVLVCEPMSYLFQFSPYRARLE